MGYGMDYEMSYRVHCIACGMAYRVHEIKYRPHKMEVHGILFSCIYKMIFIL